MAVGLYPAINSYGINGAAGVVLLAHSLVSLPKLALALATVQATKHDVIQSLWFPLLNSGFMAVVLVLVQTAIFRDPSAFAFVSLVFIGVTVYGLAVAFSTRFLSYASPKDLVQRVRRAAG